MTLDIIWDIDGTLADLSNRLHFIKDEDYFVAPFPPEPGSVNFKPDWDSFFSADAVSSDLPIKSAWNLLNELAASHNRIIFITGRPERIRKATEDWLFDAWCPWRSLLPLRLGKTMARMAHPVYMRGDTDRRPSAVVKRDLLHQARRDGFFPAVVFEDRKDDAAMWREEGLLCCQVAEGAY